MDYSLLFSRRASGQTCSRFFCPGEVLEDAFLPCPRFCLDHVQPGSSASSTSSYPGGSSPRSMPM